MKTYQEAKAYLVQMLREAKESGDSDFTIATVMAASCYSVAYIYGVSPVTLSLQVYGESERTQ